ncbi:cation diffusion facilitator family transporter [Roseomonas sp. CCTCC AB2023176]|uniref:cation diffusion facilitator family transporter n=1 Tax=Roseomonas sp. CCTCC AB2023176 TaxID=3342640 RepID=UPI0035E2FDBA
MHRSHAHGDHVHDDQDDAAHDHADRPAPPSGGHGHGGHHHGHHHGHAHGPANYDSAFALGAAMNVAFVAIEAGAGWYADSVALLADAAHNLGDVAGLLLAWWVARLGRRPATATRTYGLRRASILGALANAAFLLVAAALLGAEALRRFGAPGEVPASIVIWTAAAGIAVNAATAALFYRGRHDDLNIRGAYLHMAADAAVSLGVVVSGVLIALTGWGGWTRRRGWRSRGSSPGAPGGCSATRWTCRSMPCRPGWMRRRSATRCAGCLGWRRCTTSTSGRSARRRPR